MSEQNRSRRKRFRSSPASTAEYFEIGAPRTSGHQAGGKQKNGGRFIDDVAYNFREGFSEAPDSLANVKGTSTSEKLQYNEHLRKIKERAKLLPKDKHPNDTKSKKKKCKGEPLEVAMREQSGASSRREARTSLFGSRNERDGSEMDDDDDEDEVQEISKRYLQPRRPDSRDTSKPTTTPWTDNFLIPKKKTRNSFGLKGAPREKGSNNDKWNQESKMLNPHYSIDMSSNEVARNKRSASRKNSKSAAIDLCSDGETDSEDIDADHSTYRHRASSRTTHNADEIDKHPGKYEANNEEKHIAETVATIKNDQPYAPQISLNFFKAPSSSEGRNIQDAVALSDKSVSTERKSPVRRAFDLLKNSWMGKKSANAAQRIVPGATLESNRPQIRSGRPLESNNTRNPSVASLESNKTFTSNGVSRASRSTGLFLNDSSDDSCDPLPKLRSKDKSASKKRNKNHKDDSSDDYSPANTSNRERATLSPIYRTRSSARKKISRDSGFVKHKTNEVVDMLEDSDDEQVSRPYPLISLTFLCVSPQIDPEYFGVL